MQPSGLVPGRKRTPPPLSSGSGWCSRPPRWHARTRWCSPRRLCQCINAQPSQVAGQRRAPKCAGGRLVQHRFAVNRPALVNDVKPPPLPVQGRLACHIRYKFRSELPAGCFSELHDSTPESLSPVTCTTGMPALRHASSRVCMWGMASHAARPQLPGQSSTASSRACRFVPEDPAVEVHQQQGRPLAERAHLLLAGHGQVGPVLFRQVGFPNAFRELHDSTPESAQPRNVTGMQLYGRRPAGSCLWGMASILTPPGRSCTGPS